MRRSAYQFAAKIDRIIHKTVRGILGHSLDEEPPSVSGKLFEYSFALENVLKDLPRKGTKCKCLDVGCTDPNNCIPLVLSRLGCETYGVDIRKFELKCDNFGFLIQDIRRTSFPENYFDFIVAVSTLEHIGLSGRYGSDRDPQGDRKAVKEMARILKPSGKILMTIPYGKAAIIVDPLHRIYDKRQLSELLGNLRVHKAEYYKRDRAGRWGITTEKNARKERYTIACLSLNKFVRRSSQR